MYAHTQTDNAMSDSKQIYCENDTAAIFNLPLSDS